MGIALAAFGVWATPAASAAFPGRDGDLAVATGSGLELVNPATGAARAICTDAALCGRPTQPHFSPNGRAIAFVDPATHRPVVVAADGTCLWCLVGAPLTTVTGSEPGFEPGGHALTIAGDGLWRVSLTGGGKRRLVTGPVSDAAWSPDGTVALVRRGWIWIRRPGRGRLRRLARGRSPSFSPDGRRVAFARNGSVWSVAVRGGVARRLVAGAAPAWSPDGRRLAYIAAGGAVRIVAFHGGRAHRVGSVRGTALDWQPLPASATPACRPPGGSRILASNPEAVVFSQRSSVFGCLKALGLSRVMLNAAGCYCGPALAVGLAGRFAALESESGKPPTVFEDDTLTDLGSGRTTPLASVSLQTPGPSPVGALDSLAVDSSGFVAWRETMTPQPVGLGGMSCPSASLCVAYDAMGNILSSTDPTGGSTAWQSAGTSVVGATGGVSCPSISLCAAVGASTVLTATDPSGGASAWTTTAIAGYPDLGPISCASVSLCVAGGGGPTTTTVLTSTNPTGGASSWTPASIASGGRLAGVSCASVSLCVAVTDKGDLVTATDPTGGASAWTTATIDPKGSPNAISCPSVSMCVAVDSAGNALTSTHPTGGASAWRTANIDSGRAVWNVSCPSVALCVAVDLSGNVLYSNNPTGGASAWSRTQIAHQSLLLALSCPSVSLCVTGDQLGNILTSADPTGGASTWSSAPVDIPGCDPQSAPCISEQLHARDDQGSRMVDVAPPGRGNAIGSVALNGNSLVLSWTHDGTARQLALR